MYIGIDIGGTNARMGLFKGSKDRLISVKAKSFKLKNNFEEDIGEIIRISKQLSEDPQGVGIGLPGVVDRDKATITVSANLSDWVNKSVKQILENQLKAKIIVDHDVACAAVGESLFGHGKDINKFIYMIWGTGFGGAVVETVDNKLKITSMEPGHQIAYWDGEVCPCGQRGCFEIYIGGAGIQKRYGKKPKDIKSDKIWQEISEVASHAIINMLLLNPSETLIFGGGLITKQKHLLERMKKYLKERLVVFNQPELKLAKLGNDAGLYGAAGLFFVDRI